MGAGCPLQVSHPCGLSLQVVPSGRPRQVSHPQEMLVLPADGHPAEHSSVIPDVALFVGDGSRCRAGARSCAEPRGDAASRVPTCPPQGPCPPSRSPSRSNRSPGSPPNLGYNQDLKGNLLLVPVELKLRCERWAVMPQLCARFAWNMAVNKMKYEFY